MPVTFNCSDVGESYKDDFTDGGPKVTVIAFWPVEELSSNYEKPEAKSISCCYYRAAAITSKFSLQVITKPEQASIPERIPVVAFEESRRTDQYVFDFVEFHHSVNMTYVLGNTYYQYPSEHFDVDYIVNVEVYGKPENRKAPFYGSQVIPLIWYDRELQFRGIHGGKNL